MSKNVQKFCRGDIVGFAYGVVWYVHEYWPGLIRLGNAPTPSVSTVTVTVEDVEELELLQSNSTVFVNSEGETWQAWKPIDKGE